MQKLPSVINKDIVVQSFGSEILIYNLITHKAYCLNQTSAIVYQACGNELTFEELKSIHNVSDDLIWLALDGLKKEGLLKDAEYTSPLAAINRREVIRRVGLASMIALPVISSLTAPTAAMAQSGACGAVSPNTLLGSCTAGVGQPPATLEGCTATCQNVYGNVCTSCNTTATLASINPVIFQCRCA